MKKKKTSLLYQTKYSMKFIPWLVMESVEEIECKFNMILAWHGFLGFSKQMFQNFSSCIFSLICVSYHSEYPIRCLTF